MSPLRRTSLSRQRHRFLALVLALVIAGSVVATHTVLNADHLGEGAAMCLAIVGATALAAAASPERLGPRLGLFVVPTFNAPEPLRRIIPTARAGPPLLQVFRL